VSENACRIRRRHCEACGSTSEEDVGMAAMRAGDGYTACCNECASDGPDDCRGHHCYDDED